jgi:hypothetical protein
MDKSIDDILNDTESVEETAEVTEEVAEQPTEQSDGRERDEKGRFKSKEETGVENEPQPEVVVEPVPPTEPSNQLPPAEYAALRDERRKRQEAEQRAAAIEAHYAQLARQQQAQQPQQPRPEFWDNPEQYLQSEFAHFGERLIQQMEQKQQIERINASEQAAKSKYADYSDAYQAFEQAVQLNPRLAYELAQAPDPGEFAYSKGKTALAIQNTGSIDALRAQIRAEIEAEARAAFNPAPVRLPSTTAADGSVGARTGPAWSGPTPIDDILS